MEIDGLEELYNELDPEKFVKGALRGARKGIKKTTAAAKLLAPVKTGTLRNSIHDSVRLQNDEIEAKTYTNLEYAHYVEFGTGKRGMENMPEGAKEQDIAYSGNWKGSKPQPYMYPAFQKTQNQFIEDVITELNKEL